MVDTMQLEVNFNSRLCEGNLVGTDHVTIGELAARTGVAASALRYYEKLDLIRAERTTGNQRRYARSTIRRVSFVRIAQRVGLSLDEIRDALDGCIGCGCLSLQKCSLYNPGDWLADQGTGPRILLRGLPT